MKVYFSVNDYDFEGDLIDKNIRLHFGDTSIKVAETIKEFDDFIEQLQKMRDEIVDNYSDKNS